MAGALLLPLLLPLSPPASAAAAAGCLDELPRLTVREQLACVRSGALESLSVAALVARLEASDGATDHRVVAALLHRLRELGPTAAGAGDPIAALLSHRAALYQDRDRWEVLRLRAYAYATLSDVGVPDTALAPLMDTVGYVDERMAAVEFGAAVRAAGTLGPRGRDFIPHLLAAIGERFAEEEFSLERYETTFPPHEATTVQLETVRTLAAVAGPEDREALTVLHAIAHGSGSLDPRLVAGAREALPVVEGGPRSRPGGHEPPGPGVREAIESSTPWLAPAERPRLAHLDVRLEDHEGDLWSLDDLVDRPVLLTFFYTRCQNAGKCSTAVARLARLQETLTRRGLSESVRLLAISFEPEFDTPVRMKRYALDRGMRLGSHALSARLEPEGHVRFLAELETPVSYNGGWVNSHGVESVLIDSRGRLVRKYRTLGWDPAGVAQDLSTLLAER
ncbi:MAG: SCO family protein [Thermoanaerobaculia bacterium]|nr:SCO family protein [Thermoanaerobaculia bacterium]